MQAEVNLEMRSKFGYAMTYPHGVSADPSDPGHALYADLLRIFQSLHVVVNNGPTTVGGGGQPRVPPKPSICGESHRALPSASHAMLKSDLRSVCDV
mmetsp:Transcript_9529/g.21523  ORF Transcript_9529/g.21523 Transcript_9529/m.21523 type:complete len:97 (-) Transcript_9529:95-385(-)